MGGIALAINISLYENRSDAAEASRNNFYAIALKFRSKGKAKHVEGGFEAQ